MIPNGFINGEQDSHYEYTKSEKMLSEYGVTICSGYKNIATKATVFTIKIKNECLKYGMYHDLGKHRRRRNGRHF